MTIVAMVLVGIVAAIHVYIVVLEMVLWDTPRGRAVFGTTPEFARASRVLAANQGLYNGFLAAGLAWGLVTANEPVQIFFLLCVIVAGIFGALTVGPRILLVQAVPAGLALAAILLS